MTTNSNHTIAQLDESGSVDIVEVSPEIGEVSDEEYDVELARLERCYTAEEQESLSKYSVHVRRARSGEAPGTYMVRGSGLQILGYSVDLPEDLHLLAEAAFNRYCRGDEAA